MSKYRKIRESGVSFIFKMDDDAPDLLHIYARHLTSIDDALDVWFDPSATQVYNGQHRRFERVNATHGLFWFWLDEADKVVMVITCFTLEGAEP